MTVAKLVADNRRARFDYFIEDVIEAGISLTGTEVKSLRNGRANIAESYAAVEGHDIVLINADIPPYQQAGPHFNHEPRRLRARLAVLLLAEGLTLTSPSPAGCSPSGPGRHRWRRRGRARSGRG